MKITDSTKFDSRALYRWRGRHGKQLLASLVDRVEIMNADRIATVTRDDV